MFAPVRTPQPEDVVDEIRLFVQSEVPKKKNPEFSKINLGTHLSGDFSIGVCEHSRDDALEIRQECIRYVVLGVDLRETYMESTWELQGIQVPSQLAHPRIHFENVDAKRNEEGLESRPYLSSVKHA